MKSSGEPIAIAVDSTGVMVYRASGWVERNEEKKRYVKVYLMNVKTKEVVAMEVTTDDAHGSKVFPKLLEEAEMEGLLRSRAFDSSEIYSQTVKA